MIVAIIDLNGVTIGELSDTHLYGMNEGEEVDKEAINMNVIDLFYIEGKIKRVNINIDDILGDDKAILIENEDTGNYIIEKIKN